MFKSIYNKIILFREKRDLNKNAKDWTFKNEYQFLKYCDLMGSDSVVESYNKVLEKRAVDIIPLERKIKYATLLTPRAINTKHLKIMVEIISAKKINDIKMINKDMLYKEIIKYFVEKSKKDENEKIDYTDLFREMYALDLETSIKITGLIDKYLASLGLNK